MLSSKLAKARAGVTMVTPPAELHRLLLQQRKLKLDIDGNIWAKRELSQSVYLMH